MAALLEITRQAVEKQLRVLEEAGLVRRTRDGRVNRCTLAAGSLQSAAEWVERYRAFWEGQLDALARYVQETDHE